MFPQLLDDCLRGFRTQDAHCAQALRNWLQALAGPNVSEARGLKLLREWLTPEQLAQYDANSYFDVTGCDSGKRYRICHGNSMNVYEIDVAGNSRNGWCFVPNTPLVAGDVMLAQKIALETDERGVLVVAKDFMPSASAFRQHCSPTIPGFSGSVAISRSETSWFQRLTIRSAISLLKGRDVRRRDPS